MRETKINIKSLLNLRLKGNTSGLLDLRQSLLRETDPDLIRELKLTIVYLENLKNPFSIEHFIPSSLKEIGYEDILGSEKEEPLKKDRSYKWLVVLGLLVFNIALFLLKFKLLSPKDSF